ncbi:hypothetical protein AHAS_Ahas02G0135400 [Arachis hypogaea]
MGKSDRTEAETRDTHKSTTEVIYLLRRMMERYCNNKKDLHIVFIDLKKTYDRVLREVLWKV